MLQFSAFSVCSIVDFCFFVKGSPTSPPTHSVENCQFLCYTVIVGLPTPFNMGKEVIFHGKPGVFPFDRRSECSC